MKNADNNAANGRLCGPALGHPSQGQSGTSSHIPGCFAGRGEGGGEFIHFPAAKDKKRGQTGVSCARGAGSSVEVTAGD